MNLITVEAPLSDIDAGLAHVEAQAGVVRAMDGCTHYAPYARGSHLAIVQEWESLAAFDAYRASPAFATLGAQLKPLMTAPPVTKVAELTGP
ncbi:MAG: antibiotic biosynthesis monooxygenase [Pseudomonadota bacterium]